MARGSATQSAPSQPLPGQFFDYPGVPGGSSQWTDQDDSTVNLVTTLAQGAQTAVNGIIQFRQTDVVTDWYAIWNIQQTYTTGSSTITASAWAPYTILGPTRLVIQNQYASVDVESGIDLYIFNILRPYNFASETFSGINNYSNPAGDPIGGSAQGYLAAALAQVNQINAAIWSTAVTGYNLILRLPAGQWFDRYFDLANTGEPLSPGHPAMVSPQYMAGTTRVIAPTILMNGGSGTTTDLGPTNISSGSGTFVGSSALRLRRRAIYAGSPVVSPPVYAWQYKWKTQRFSLSGTSRADLLVPLDTGQLLALYVRMFDPAAAAALGAPININVVSRFNLQYGSGLLRLDGQTFGNQTAMQIIQRYWLSQHNTMLPAGVIAIDLALDERGQMTNARALNTLTTAGILAHLEFTGAQSGSSYAVMGTESLVYVT